MERDGYRTWVVTAAIAGGAALGAYGIAGAATSSTTTKPPSSAPSFHSNENPAHEKGESAQREAEENSGHFRFRGGAHDGGPGCQEAVVTGATAAKIKAAALKAVPGAKVTKTEKRADGSYEAELTKPDGTEAHLSLDKNFKVIADRRPDFGRRGWGYHGQPRAGYGNDAPNGAPSA